MGVAGIGTALAVVYVAGFLMFLAMTHLYLRSAPPISTATIPSLSFGEASALSFVLGTGFVSLQMFFYSLLGIRFHPASIAVPWIVLAALWWRVPDTRRSAITLWRQRTHGVSEARRGIDTCLVALVWLQVAYVFFYALSFPIAGWDAWANWLMKARAFFLTGEVSTRVLRDGRFLVPDYPLHIPLAVTSLYVAAGGIEDHWVKVLYPLLFSSLLLVFNGLARIMTARRNALFFTALLASVPIAIIQGGGLPASLSGFGTNTHDDVGYADLALSLCFLCSGGLLALGFHSRLSVCFYWAALFVGLGMWTKNEGLPFALCGSAAILWAVRSKFFAIAI